MVKASIDKLTCAVSWGLFMKKIIVLGATGQIGSNVAVYLKERNYEVVAVGRRSSDNGFF